LIRLISGDLDPDAAAVVERHLHQCPACAAIKDDLSATWETLGAWVDPAPAPDLWPTVQATLAVEARREATWLPQTTPALLRAAACIAVAVGLGWAAGAWLVPGEQDTGGHAATAAVEMDDVLEPLGLDAFMVGSATGLQGAFETTELDDGQEGVS
jgi:anti-sigma factor RsiW